MDKMDSCACVDYIKRCLFPEEQQIWCSTKPKSRRKMRIQDIKSIIICTIPIILSMFVTLFFYSDLKLDVYLFYDHARFVDNIFYDVSNLATASIFTWYASKWKRNIFMPFFIISLVEWVLYFTFYKQMASLMLLPLLVFLIILYNRKK